MLGPQSEEILPFSPEDLLCHIPARMRLSRVRITHKRAREISGCTASFSVGHFRSRQPYAHMNSSSPPRVQSELAVMPSYHSHANSYRNHFTRSESIADTFLPFLRRLDHTTPAPANPTTGIPAANGTSGNCPTSGVDALITSTVYVWLNPLCPSLSPQSGCPLLAVVRRTIRCWRSPDSRTPTPLHSPSGPLPSGSAQCCPPSYLLGLYNSSPDFQTQD